MQLWDKARWEVAKWFLKRVGIPRAMRMVGMSEKPWSLNSWRTQSELDLDLIEKVAWVYACTRVISENCAKVPLRVKRVVAENLEEDIFDHPFERVLDSPNPFDDRFSLLEATFAPLKATGRAFWYIPTNALGEVAQIWPLLPSRMYIVPDKRNFVKSYVYQMGATKIPFRPDEILMFKSWSPLSQFEGMGALKPSADAVEQDQLAQTYGLKFFQNAAIPAGFLVTDQFLTPKQLKSIEETYQSKYGGEDKAGAMAVLHGGLKYQQLMLDPEKAMMIASRLFSAKEIMTAFGVPPTEIGMISDVGRGTAEALHVVFLENVIEPLLKRVSWRITQGILQNGYYKQAYANDRLVASFGDVIPVHTETRSRAAERNARATLTLIRALGADEGLEEAKRQGLVSQHATMGIPLVFGGQELLTGGGKKDETTAKEDGNINKQDKVAIGGEALKGISEVELAVDRLDGVAEELRSVINDLD